MKKKYVTPKLEKIQCMSEGFMAGSGSKSGSQQTPAGNNSLQSEENAAGQKSKWHDTWDTWED